MGKNDGCFSLTKVSNVPDIYRLSLLESQRMTRNIYILNSKDEILIVDPVLHNHSEYDIFCQTLKQLVQEHQKIKVFYTHFHIDNLKATFICFPVGTQVYVSGYGPAIDDMEKVLSYQNVRFRKEGYPKEVLKEWSGLKSDENWLKDLLLTDNVCQEPIQIIRVNDGDSISAGEWTGTCIYTPGHTLGHMCLGLKEKGILFSGDTILLEDLPSVGIWKGKTSALDYMFDSMKRLEDENYRSFFPSHGEFGMNCIERIKEMSNRYYFRILEMYRLVYDYSEKNAYELSRLFCHCGEKCQNMSAKKQWYAMGETLAYLVYLRERKYVSSCRSDRGMINGPGKRKITDY